MALTPFIRPLLAASLLGAAIGVGLGNPRSQSPIPPTSGPSTTFDTSILVAAGGGAPAYNEIALEKNVRYFQRTLSALDIGLSSVSQYFANGSDGEATVRYLDWLGRERFKVPEIPALDGAATVENMEQWFTQRAIAPQDCSSFFYFTGHGAYNRKDQDNNAMILWHEELVSVQRLAGWLDRLPPDRPFVTMMAQCYSGAFANIIYEQGNPSNPVALQSRCGFFATVAERPSVGCTPAVNEADYRDYSSSFFAGLSGRDRTGEKVASADYDGSGQGSYTEAHALAKVDEATTDWPVSTSEAWLQRRASRSDRAQVFSRPLQEWTGLASPQRRYVVAGLVAKLEFDLEQPYAVQARPEDIETVAGAYWVRLGMELVNIAMIERIQTDGSDADRAVLNQLLTCEAGHLTEAVTQPPELAAADRRRL